MSVTFGLALDLGSMTQRLDEKLDGYVELIRHAENFAFDSVSAGESYPTRETGGHLPSPLLALAALAPRTHLRIGTGVILVPAWNPLRLAYDTAVLDQISGGRLFLGVGLGSAPMFKRFGGDPTRVADYMDDTLGALHTLWSGESGFIGKMVSIEGGIGVLPVQAGGPPLWVGGSIRRSTVRAAIWGSGWIASSNYGFPAIEQQSLRYRESLATQDKDAGAAQVMINRLTLVAETEAEARRDARKWVGLVLQAYARSGALGDDPAIRSGSPEELFEKFDDDWCLVGTPDQVTAKIRRYADAGVTHIQARVSPADIPAELATRTVELLGSDVLPHFS